MNTTRRVFVCVCYLRVCPGAVPGPGCTAIRRPQQQQLRRGRLCDILVPARLSAAGPTGCHVLGWRTAHMERSSAKVCGYVLSRFHSLDVRNCFLRVAFEAQRSLDLEVYFFPHLIRFGASTAFPGVFISAARSMFQTCCQSVQCLECIS